MSSTIPTETGPTKAALARMHARYCQGSLQNRMAPHVIYTELGCPHPSCSQRLQGIDFRVECYGPAVHDAVLRAWWTDEGIAGRCPGCGHWVHFRIRDKRAISDEDAARLVQLPADWADHAVLL